MPTIEKYEAQYIVKMLLQGKAIYPFEIGEKIAKKLLEEERDHQQRSHCEHDMVEMKGIKHRCNKCGFVSDIEWTVKKSKRSKTS